VPSAEYYALIKLNEPRQHFGLSKPKPTHQVDRTNPLAIS
jgi:hypothetical protein